VKSKRFASPSRPRRRLNHHLRAGVSRVRADALLGGLSEDLVAGASPEHESRWPRGVEAWRIIVREELAVTTPTHSGGEDRWVEGSLESGADDAAPTAPEEPRRTAAEPAAPQPSRDVPRGASPQPGVHTTFEPEEDPA